MELKQLCLCRRHVLLDYIEQDLSDLASMPVGSHIGQLNIVY